jgi:6-phosphogluconolactonase
MRWIRPAALAMLVGPCACGDSGATDSGGVATTSSAGSGSAGDATAMDAASSPSTSGSDATVTSLSGVDTSGDPDSTSAGADPGPLVVYVSDGDAQVHLWSADETGSLTASATYDTGPGAGQLAIHPDGRHLYATARLGPDGPRIFAYEIAPDSGSLTQLGVTPIGLSPVYLAIDPSGQVAMIADYGSGAIETYAIAGDFTIAAGPAYAQAVGEQPHAIVTDPSGTHVYVPHLGSNEIWQFSLDPATGQLTPLTPATVDAPPGAGARHLSFHPSGEHAYLSGEVSDTLSHFSRAAASGQLTLLETVTSLPPQFDGAANTTADVHVAPDGASVYLSNRGHDSIAMFTLDPRSGAPALLGQVSTEAAPREFDVDPAGAYLYAAGQDSGQLAGYMIDPNGGLPMQIGTWPIGGSPAWCCAFDSPRAADAIGRRKSAP